MAGDPAPPAMAVRAVVFDIGGVAAQRAGLQAILFTDNAQAIAEIDARLRQ
jgi:hypothetical protein